MIAVLVCDRDGRERELLSQNCRKQIAGSCEEELHVDNIPDDTALTRVTNQEQLVNLLYYRFSKGQSVQALRLFRKNCGDAMVMLITDPSVSPLEYLRPGIAPDSLAFRPLKEEQFSEANREFISSFLERFQESEGRFLLTTRDEKALIPWSYIYYFEARDKKIFVRTRHEEYAFYDTMEKLESRLPEMFRRCHRSYIVNTSKILRVISAENYLELTDSIGVPLSRGYRLSFQDLLKKTEVGI
ncbi:MAG: LytTR family transcriptional regulator DNA-binding domain-containing protein [Oscillibacter sp.]|nr:LytTR family transcriptional regulator DNA-binding domain-containing protein [Oscillibacter sp.]